MPLSGIELVNPLLGTRLITSNVEEGRGAGFELEYFIEPDHQRDQFLHVHNTWTERFEIIAGEARYMIAGIERKASAGDSVDMPAGIPHLHPWNTGRDVLHMRQVVTIDPPSFDAVREVGYGVATLYGLAREGKVNSKGMPNLLQLAVILRAFQRHGIYVGNMPQAVQRSVFGILAAVGRAVGYRPFYQQYIEE